MSICLLYREICYFLTKYAFGDLCCVFDDICNVIGEQDLPGGAYITPQTH